MDYNVFFLIYIYKYSIQFINKQNLHASELIFFLNYLNKKIILEFF